MSDERTALSPEEPCPICDCEGSCVLCALQRLFKPEKVYLVAEVPETRQEDHQDAPEPHPGITCNACRGGGKDPWFRSLPCEACDGLGYVPLGREQEPPSRDAEAWEGFTPGIRKAFRAPQNKKIPKMGPGKELSIFG